jgi:hypothetical protein
MSRETKHHFSESEKAGYVSFVNDVLAEEEALSSVLPIDPASADLFEVVKNGVLLWYASLASHLCVFSVRSYLSSLCCATVRSTCHPLSLMCILIYTTHTLFYFSHGVL